MKPPDKGFGAPFGAFQPGAAHEMLPSHQHKAVSIDRCPCSWHSGSHLHSCFSNQIFGYSLLFLFFLFFVINLMWPGARIKIITALPAFSPHHLQLRPHSCLGFKSICCTPGYANSSLHTSQRLRFTIRATQQCLKLSLKSPFPPLPSPFSLFFNPFQSRSPFSAQYCLSLAINEAL